MNDYDAILDEQAQTQAQTTAPTTIYDDVLDKQATVQERALRGTFVEAQAIAPERAAENQRLSAITGIPASIVNREFDSISKRVQIDGKPYEQMMRESPALTSWLIEQPANAAVAQDDLEQLGAIEWLVTAPQRAFAQGMSQLEVARLRTKSMQTILTQEEQDLLNASKYHMQLGGANGAGDSWFRKAVTGLSGQLPILFGSMGKGAERSVYTVPAAFAFGAGAFAVGAISAPVSVPVMFGAGLTAGMVTGGAEFAFELEAGLAYDEFLTYRDELDQPLAPEVAKTAAITAGALNAGLEVVGLGVLAKTIPGVNQLKGIASRRAVTAALRSPTVRAALFEAGKTYVGALASETAVEVAQRGVTVMAGELGKYAGGQDFDFETKGEGDQRTPFKTSREISTDLANEAVSAMQTFSLMIAPGPTIGAAVDIRRANQASRNADFFKALGDGVTSSKTFERQPAAARDFIERATKDGPIANVYAPIDTWTTYWQSKGVDPEEMATEVTGNPRAYAEAKASGLDLQISTADYAVKLAGTEHNTALAQELRLAPDAMNAREAQEFIAEQEAAAAEAMPAPAADEVRTKLLQQLQVALAGSGITLPAGALERYADVYQSVVGTLAEREGIDPGELFARYGLEVLGPQEQGPTRPAGPTAPTEGGPTVDDMDNAVAAASGVPDMPADAREALERAGFVIDTGERRRETDAQGARTTNAQPAAADTASSFTPEVQRQYAAELAKDPTLAAAGREGMRRLSDINANRIPEPPRDGGTVEGEPPAPATAQSPVDPARQAQQLLNNAFPPGSAEREEIIQLRKTSDPADFKEFLQDVFAPQPPAETMALHAVGDADGPQAFAWGFYAASLRELGERYSQVAGVTPGLQPTEDVFLNWDARASQQPAPVQQALRALGVRWSRDTDPMGSEVYRYLSKATEIDETGAAEASRVLNQHGVLGTRYSDAGVPNYVSFDKSLGPVELWQSERPKGFDAIAAHLTPAERDKLKRDHAERLVAIFKDLPPDRDFSDAALAGIAKRGWYRESAVAILHIFGDVDGPRFAALLAALSPQTSVEANLYNTVSVWKNWTQAGRPTDRAGILKVMARSVQGNKGVDSVLASWVPNAVRALAADDPKTIVLSGPKVHSFYRNLVGEVNEVTNDAWMASFALIDKTILGGSINKAGTDPGKGPGYLAMIAKIRRVAKKLTAETGETWTPDEVQETIWSWAKSLYEMAEAEGEDAETIIREGRLSDALIAATPDFKNLFTTDPTVRALLEAAGYGDAIAALESELGGSVDRNSREPGGVATGTGTQNRPATLGTLRSARRLSTLARQRQEAARLKEGTELHQEVRPAVYSRILETIALTPTTKASGAQWKATIRNSKLGVNADEFALTHVDDLEDDKTYTKDEVQQYLRTHRVEVGQVVLGAPRGERGKEQLRDEEAFEQQVQERAQELYDQAVDGEREHAENYWESSLRYTVVEQTNDVDDPDNPDDMIEVSTWHVVAHFGRYGGESNEHSRYDEAFDTEGEAEEWMDSQAGQEWKWELEDFERDDYFQNFEFDTTFSEAEDDARRELEGEDGSEASHDTHYENYILKGLSERGSYREAFVTAEERPPDPGAVAALEAARVNHARVAAEAESLSATIREIDVPVSRDAPGAPERLARERQRQALSAELVRLREEMSRLRAAVNQEWVDGHSDYDHVKRPIVRLRFNVRNGYSLEELAAYQGQAPASSPESLESSEKALERINAPKKRVMFLDEVQPPQPVNFARMPALFQKFWREVAFKWALRYAAEHNLDVVAWTTGAQQQDRYSLRKQVSKISWSTPVVAEETGTSPTGWARAGGMVDPGDPVRAVIVNAHDGGVIKLIVNYETGTVLHAVGHASHWAGESLSSVMGSELADQVLNGAEGVIEGEGLEVGGVGLARLYDVDFRNVVNALPAVKKNKGKVGRFSIGIPLGAFRLAPDIQDVSQSPTVTVAVVKRLSNGFIKVMRPFLDRASADRWLVETAPTPGEAPEERYIITRPVDEGHYEHILQMDGPNHSVVSAGGRWTLRQWHVQDAANVSQRVFQSAMAAEAYMHDIGAAQRALEPKLLQHGVEITPAIKAAVMGGQVLFQSPTTAAFKQWFGDSKVVDSKGQPRRVFHGTTADDFEVFEGLETPGWFAEGLALPAAYSEYGTSDSPRTIPVYLSIQKPLDATNRIDMNDDVTFDKLQALFPELDLSRMATAGYADSRGSVWEVVNNSHFFRALSAAGFDGLKINERGYATWAPVDPRQIKNAISNTGAYDPRNPSMLEQPQRGSISFGPDRQFTIKMFSDADVSTFMHESAHLFLEMLQDLGTEQNASDQLKGDLQILREQLFSIDADAPIGVREHELFARGFEAYLMTGKAPSVSLRGVFNQFRAWLVKLYRTLSELDVTLTDDVRGVFDRMMATDRAILEAQAEFEVTPMFTTAESAGMSPEEFGRYQQTVADASRKARETLEAKLLQEVRRAQKRAWRAQADDTREEVTKAVEQQPVYQALAAMRRGTRPDGSPLVDGVLSEPLLLSKAILVERYGENILRDLPRPYVYSAEGGLDPDVVGQMFGFSSGDAMLKAITGAPAMEQAIAQQTQQLMSERYGDMVLEGRIPDEAKAALANDNRDAIIRAELRALGQLRRTVAPFEQAAAQDLGAEKRERAYERRWFEAEAKLKIAEAKAEKQEVIDALRAEVMNLRRKSRGGAATVRAGIPSEETLRDAARTRIGRTRIRDLRPATFWSGAKRASTKATELAAKGDFDGAIVAKQEELINLALYRQATQAQEQVDKRVRQTSNLSTPASRARLGRAGADYLDQIEGILDRYDFAKATQKVLNRRQALRQWVAQLEGQGLPVDLPDSVLDDARRMHYKDLSFEEFLAVTDSVQQIAHLARLKLTLLTKRKNADLQATVDALVTSIRGNATRRQPRRLETRLPTDQALRLIDAFFASHRKMASLAREMDGFEDGGAMWEAIILPLNQAGDREAVMNAAATKALGELVSNAYQGREKVKLYEKQFITAIGDSLTKMGRLMVALNWGNEGNRQRVMAGYSWNEQQVQAILDTLDQRDWRFVQGVWDFIDGYWPEIAAKQERVTGLAPEKVEAVEVRTKFGNMKGGYFPIKNDDRLSAKAGTYGELETAQLQRQAAYVNASTRRGHTKARAEKSSLPVRLDFGVIFEHVNQVIHDLSHHEALIDIGRIMGHGDVQKAIYDTYGDVVYKQFKGGLKDVAIGLPQATEAHERVFNHARVGSTVALLGWNLTTASMQPLGLTQSMVRIGPTWVARGMGRWLKDAATMENTVAWISERSDFMKLRGQTQQREINEIRNQVGINTGKVAGWLEEILRTVTLDQVSQTGIADSYFFLIQQMQRVADVPTWLGQYEKSMAAGETEERAIQLADQAVIDAQGGGQTKDLAAVQRGPAAWRLWTNFYSFFSTTYQQTAESTRRTKFSSPGAVGRLAVDYALLYIVPATLGYFLRQAMKGDEPDEDELLQELVAQNVAYAMGTVMGLRELAGAVQGYSGYEGPAGARGFATAARLMKQVGQGEADAAFWRTLNDSAGILFHYPSGQMRRTIEGIAAVIEGRTKNPGALIVGPPAER